MHATFLCLDISCAIHGIQVRNDLSGTIPLPEEQMFSPWHGLSKNTNKRINIYDVLWAQHFLKQTTVYVQPATQ